MTEPDQPAVASTDGDPGQAVPERCLDGNAAAGPLRELFAVDLTAAACTCGHCGATAPVAGHILYADAPAMVLRCPGCTEVVLRYSTTGGRLRLDLSGARLVTSHSPAPR